LHVHAKKVRTERFLGCCSWA